jgi:hypothetical protein
MGMHRCGMVWQRVSEHHQYGITNRSAYDRSQQSQMFPLGRPALPRSEAVGQKGKGCMCGWCREACCSSRSGVRGGEG